MKAHFCICNVSAPYADDYLKYTPCGSGLAREGGVSGDINIGCAAVFASKPAPTFDACFTMTAGINHRPARWSDPYFSGFSDAVPNQTFV